MEFIVVLVLLTAGYFSGQYFEKRHYESLKERERTLLSTPIITSEWKKTIQSEETGELFTGSVVIASDYFKSFASSLKSIFGGRLNSYESLLDRGRREAILRMKEQAHHWGAERIVNLRIETSTISGGRNLPCIEVVAYGTALKREYG